MNADIGNELTTGSSSSSSSPPHFPFGMTGFFAGTAALGGGLVAFVGVSLSDSSVFQ